MDWAMKFLPTSFRETQRDWFGKKGKSWHVSVALTKSNEDNIEVGNSNKVPFALPLNSNDTINAIDYIRNCCIQLAETNEKCAHKVGGIAFAFICL